MEFALVIEQAERRRRAAISLFVAATVGMAAILSLPVIRLLPIPFVLGPAELQGPPATVQDPFFTESAPTFESGRLGRARAHTSAGPASDGAGSGDSNGGSDVPGQDDGPSPVPVDVPVPGAIFHKDKLPKPPSTTQQSTGDGSSSVEASTQEDSGSIGGKGTTQEETLQDP